MRATKDDDGRRAKRGARAETRDDGATTTTTFAATTFASLVRRSLAKGYLCAFVAFDVVHVASFVLGAFGAREYVKRETRVVVVFALAAEGACALARECVERSHACALEGKMYETIAFEDNGNVKGESIKDAEWAMTRAAAAARRGGGGSTTAVVAPSACAVVCAALIALALAHCLYVGYVDEGDVFASLALARGCFVFIRFAAGRSRRAKEAANAAFEPEIGVQPAKEGAAIAPNAIVTEKRQIIALIGDGRSQVLERLARGAIAVGSASDVGAKCALALRLEREWILPEPLERFSRVSVNARAFGTAASRVNDIERSRLMSLLGDALCASERHLTYAAEPRAKRFAVDDTFRRGARYACDIGFERARISRAGVVLCDEPCREMLDVERRVSELRRRCRAAAVERRQFSCVFTTTDIAILPFCDRIVFADAHGDIPFVGSFDALRRCDEAAIRRALRGDDANRTPVPRFGEISSPRPREIDCERASRARKSVIVRAFIFARTSPRRRAAFGVIACSGIGPAMSTFALERWLAGKRVGSSSNALLFIGVSLAILCALGARALRGGEKRDDVLANARAFAAVVYVAIALAACVAPRPAVSAAALLTPFVLLFHVDVAFHKPVTSRAMWELYNARVRAAHCCVRVAEGKRHIRVATATQFYRQILQRVVEELNAAARRARDLRALERSWMLLLVTSAFALAVTVVMNDDASSKRGVVAVVGLLAFAAIDVRPETPTPVARADAETNNHEEIYRARRASSTI